MARSRNIKPAFFSNDKLAELPALTRLLFIGLWTIADRDGRLEDRPARIRAEVLPYDTCDCDAMLAALSERGFIQRYTAAGVACIQIVAFAKHQNPHVREVASTLPPASKSHQHNLGDASAEPRQGSASANPELARLIPDSLLLIPDSPLPLTDSLPGPPPSASGPQKARTTAVAAKKTRPTAARRLESNGKTSQAWRAYGDAYEQRHGVPPVRNGKTNRLMQVFVERVGVEEAPHVAAHFVRSNRGLYVSSTHALDLLVRDAESLRTEWATRRHGTDTQARQADRTATTGSTFDKLIGEVARNGTEG